MKKIGFIFLLVFVATSSFAQRCANYHVVASGETLYSISRKYGLTIAEMQTLNPGLVTTIKLGERLCLPDSVEGNQSEVVQTPAVKPTPETDSKPQVNREVKITKPPVKKEEYAMALLLPFSTYQMSNDSLDERSVKLRNVSVNMYRGAMMAQEELQDRNLNAKIYLFDVGNSVDAGKRAVERCEEVSADVVIGPLFKDPIQEVAKWVENHNAHLVIPVKMSNKILLLTDNMSKAYPGITLLVSLNMNFRIQLLLVHMQKEKTIFRERQR